VTRAKKKVLALGQYPDLSLIAARERCDEARRLLASGIDPRVRRRENSVTSLMEPGLQVAARSFEAVARIDMVYRREKVLGRCTANPAEDVTALLAKPRRTNHAALSYQDLPAFFARLDVEDLEATTRLGLEGVIATWLRSTELRLAGWQWLNWQARELRIPSSDMKNGDKRSGDHVVHRC
jgi:integrase